MPTKYPRVEARVLELSNWTVDMDVDGSASMDDARSDVSRFDDSDEVVSIADAASNVAISKLTDGSRSMQLCILQDSIDNAAG